MLNILEVEFSFRNATTKKHSAARIQSSEAFLSVIFPPWFVPVTVIRNSTLQPDPDSQPVTPGRARQ